MRYILSLALCHLFFLTLLHSQVVNFEFGEVSNYEKSMTIYPYDSAATAVILSDYGIQSMNRDDNGYIGNFFHVKRIKILDRKAIDEYGNVHIDFYSHEKQERISGVKAHTIQPDGSIEKVGRKDIFNGKLNEQVVLQKI